VAYLAPSPAATPAIRTLRFWPACSRWRSRAGAGCATLGLLAQVPVPAIAILALRILAGVYNFEGRSVVIVLIIDLGVMYGLLALPPGSDTTTEAAARVGTLPSDDRVLLLPAEVRRAADSGRSQPTGRNKKPPAPGHR